MKVIRIKPRCSPELMDIPNTLEALQKEVGGFIETLTFASDCCIVCNEEGMNQRLPVNLSFCGNLFFGTILFVGVRGEDFCDVPEKLQERFADGCYVYQIRKE